MKLVASPFHLPIKHSRMTENKHHKNMMRLMISSSNHTQILLTIGNLKAIQVFNNIVIQVAFIQTKLERGPIKKDT